MTPVTSITIIYDSGCGLCTRTKDWMLQQVPLVALQFVPAESPQALQRFPQLPGGELAVVADTGEVWLGNHAWIVCLWALRDYRNLALKLTSPLLLMLARQAFALVSNNRKALSSLLSLKSEHEMEQQLRKAAVPACQTGTK